MDRNHREVGGFSVNECQAVRFLSADGYSVEKLSGWFGVSDGLLCRHINRECEHPNISDPVRTKRLYGEELRQRRLEAGLTQSDLAGRLDLSTATVSNWEQDKNRPRLGNAHRLWDALGLEPETVERG